MAPDNINELCFENTSKKLKKSFKGWTKVEADKGYHGN